MSSIKWDNIGYSFINRLFRKIIVWIIAVLMVVLAFYYMVQFKDYSDGLSAAAPTTSC